MKRCFIFKDDKSQKFWNIDVNENEFTVTYGKLGTAGQSKTKSFEDQTKCDREAQKLIKEKERKGYKEIEEEQLLNEKTAVKRYALTYNDIYEREPPRDKKYLINKILNDKDISDLEYIIIGCWGIYWHKTHAENSCQELIDMFVENKEKFKNLKFLFIGDMTSEECEISWIHQGDYTELLKALPNLEGLRIKGSDGLIIKDIKHKNLKDLDIQCGGLPKSVLNELAKSSLPNLTSLQLYIGIDCYGFDGSMEDIKPLISKKLFPNLKELAIIDSDLQDEITEEIMKSDILPQLEILNLSYGTLSDKGAEILIENKEKLSNLKRLIISHHYITENVLKRLKKELPCSYKIDGYNEYEEDYGRYPFITE